MEGNMKRLMTSAIQGTPTGLQAAGQTAIALWATKEALLLDLSQAYVRGVSYAPSHHLRWLFEHQAPPPTTVVWIGGVRDIGRTKTWTHVSVRLDPDDTPAYLAAFSIGHVLFQVMGLEDPTVWPVGDSLYVPPVSDHSLPSSAAR